MSTELLLGQAWAALGGDPGLLARLTVAPEARPLGGPLDADALAAACAGSALLAALELRAARGGGDGAAALDPRHLAIAFASERHARRAGVEPPASLFADLSRFARTADGWIRLHANYPHHRAALLSVIGSADAIASWRAEELETAVVAAGGAAAAVRSADAWRAHPQGVAVAGLPLVDRAPVDAAAGRSLPPLADPARPAAGVRVLDLTRVIAGPVGTRTLAALGADVLRIDPPALPELPEGWLDAGPGKRSALLDLRTAAIAPLLAEADVLVHGYRPGALDAFGLDGATLAARHPHLVVVALSAWGHAGPWARRRGFDSLVQAATGIAAELAAPDGTPGALPVQALDHGTGHLVAAAALRGLAERQRTGHAAHARFALARLAHLLLDAPRTDAPPAPVDPAPALQRLGDVTLVAPPGTLDGTPLRWPAAPRPFGGDPPAFAV